MESERRDRARQGDPLTRGGVVPGSTYYYQTYYRNPNAAWCPSATFNISNGLAIAWPQ